MRVNVLPTPTTLRPGKSEGGYKASTFVEISSRAAEPAIPTVEKIVEEVP